MEGDHPEPFRQLSAELSNITILALGGFKDRIPLRSLMLYFTSLRVLRLMGYTGVWVRHFSFQRCKVTD